MITNLGFNLNEAISAFLDPFHNIVEIDYYPYQGETNTYGAVKPSYSPAITVPAQVQVPTPAQARLVEKSIDIKYVKVFYINAEIRPAARVDQLGGDIILHDGKYYYVDAISDDFRQVGWMSVLGVEVFDGIPEIAVVDPDAETTP